MSKKIRITESQLKVLLENNKKSIKEQEAWNRDPSNTDNYFDGDNDPRDNPDFDKEEEESHNDNFDSPDELLLSVSERLSNAITTQDWALVHEVFNDVRDFISNKVSKEDLPTIGDESSVMNDTPEEHDERNYSISESIEKIKLNFKRFI
jgi:hypothetical protein